MKNKMDLGTYLEKLKNTRTIEEATISLNNKKIIIKTNKEQTKIILDGIDIELTKNTKVDSQILEHLTNYKQLLSEYLNEKYQENSKQNVELSKITTAFQFTPIALNKIYSKALKPLTRIVMFFKGISEQDVINQNVKELILGSLLATTSKNMAEMLQHKILKDIDSICKRIIDESVKTCQTDKDILNGKLI
jgi:hypothetical protein